MVTFDDTQEAARDGGRASVQMTVQFLRTNPGLVRKALDNAQVDYLPGGVVPVFRLVAGQPVKAPLQAAKAAGYGAITCGYGRADLETMCAELANLVEPRRDARTGAWQMAACALVQISGPGNWQIWRLNRTSGDKAARQQVLGKAGPVVANGKFKREGKR